MKKKKKWLEPLPQFDLKYEGTCGFGNVFLIDLSEDKRFKRIKPLQWIRQIVGAIRDGLLLIWEVCWNLWIRKIITERLSLLKAAKGKLREKFFEISRLADNVSTSAIGNTTIFVGFMISANTAFQAYHSSLAFAWICFLVAVLGTLLACWVAYSPLPDIVRCLDDIAEEDRLLGVEVEQLATSDQQVDPAAAVVISMHASFLEKARALEEKIHPTRFMKWRILLGLVLFFGIASAGAIIFQAYNVASSASASSLRMLTYVQART